MNLESLKAGDKVSRYMDGKKLFMRMIVREVKEKSLICDALELNGTIFRGGWEFDKRTGAEIDDDLGWGPPPKSTGTYIAVDER